MSESKNKASIRLSLEIDYELDGESLEQLKAQLRSSVESMIGSGGLTGYGPATVDSWSMSIRDSEEKITPSAYPTVHYREEGSNVSIPAAQGLRVYVLGLLDQHDQDIELHQKFSHEGIVTDVINPANDNDPVVETDSEMYEDIVSRLM